MNNIKKYNSELKGKIQCDLNVDRTKFLDYNNQNYIISACYHLNKSTNTKTGSMNINNLNKPLEKVDNKIDLNFGVLDFKFFNYDFKLYTITANSDDSFSFIELNMDEDHNLNFFHKKTINCQSPKTDTNNVVEISNDNNTLLFGLNDGTIKAYDFCKEKFTFSKKEHSYAIWSVLSRDNNVFYTGSDDSQILIWDLREPKSVNFNKKHQAGVTALYKDISDPDNIILSGSYDESINYFDIRNPRVSLYSNKIHKTVWDIKQTVYDSKSMLFISCIYDGFKIYSREEGKLEEIHDFTEHKSIVYGVDIINKNEYIEISSCSFYDNLICYWHFK